MCYSPECPTENDIKSAVSGAQDALKVALKATNINLGRIQSEISSRGGNTIPDGTKASAAGLSGCARVTRMRSGEKGEVRGKRGSARRLNE